MNCTTSPASLCPLMLLPFKRRVCTPRAPSIMEKACRRRYSTSVELKKGFTIGEGSTTGGREEKGGEGEIV